MTTITTEKRAAALYIPLSRNARVLGIGLMLLVVVLQAHIENSTVFGTITRQDDQPTKNVFVSIARKAAYTDERGRYRIDEVPFGPQEMVVSSGGHVLLKVVVNITSSEQKIDKKLP